MKRQALLSIQIDPAFRTAVKRAALDRGCTVQALVHAALAAVVEGPPPKPNELNHENPLPNA